MDDVTFKKENGVPYISDTTSDKPVVVETFGYEIGCERLCYDCCQGSYCWLSECNQNSN